MWTHESMARSGGALVECQEHSIADLLKYGIRMFDIRCKNDHNACAIYHAFIYQHAYFNDFLDPLVAHLAAHPSEVVLVRIKEETSSSGSTRDLKDTIRAYLNDDKYKNFYWSGGTNLPTVGEARGKFVIIDQISGYLGPAYFACGLCGGGGDPCVSDCIQDEYNVPTILGQDIDNKWGYAYDMMQHANGAPWDGHDGGDASKLYINFLSGSSGGAYPNAVADRINPKFMEELRIHKMNYKQIGVTMMDFPWPEQVMLIIDMNYIQQSVNAEFFEDMHLEGDHKIFTISPGECINFEYWDERASSVDVKNNGCVRVYDSFNCEGNSADMRQDWCAYSFPSCGWNDRARSISQCD